jgi:polyvinyl alcohol dehydrogenase (cytochrome)
MLPHDLARRPACPTRVAAVAAGVLLGVIAAAAPRPPAAAPRAPDEAPASAMTGDAQPGHTYCAERDGALALGSAQWNGWGNSPDNTRYQPEPAIRATDVPKLALKWAFGYAGAPGAGQPTLVDGRLFVASASGRIYSLDAQSGCTYWTYDAAAGVHTGISIAELSAPRHAAPSKRSRKGKHKLTNAHLEVIKAPCAALFGDAKGTVYALDAQSGALLWKTQVESHPLARIEGSTLHLGRLYVAVGSSEPESARDPGYGCCTFRGSVAALDVASGHIEWKSYLVNEEPRPVSAAAGGAPRFAPAGVPVAAAPTVDAARSLVYVATGDASDPTQPPQPEAQAQALADAVVALELADGKVRWVKQFAAPQPGLARIDSPPVLRTLASGRETLLVSQRSGIVYALDPEHTGEVLWQFQAAAPDAPGGISRGAAADHRSLYVPLSGLDAEPPNAAGSLTAIDIKAGTRRWHTASPTPACNWGESTACEHAQVQPVTVIPGAAFSGSMDGHLRAYSTIDGKILWDYDTAKDYRTVNQVQGTGGSLQAGGATIVNGVVYVNSGGAEGQPGNVLLAFSVNGQ